MPPLAQKTRTPTALDAAELAAVQSHFRALRREPTPAELETLARAWSEPCRSRTFAGPVRFSDGRKTRRFKSLLDETIVKASRRLNRAWCLSSFQDDAGIVAFGPKWALAFKVETHNHPSAIEPYGGAETGVGATMAEGSQLWKGMRAALASPARYRA